MRQIEKLGPYANVRVETVDKYTGDLIDTRESHNVLTNVGRNWLRDLCCVKAYPAPIPAGGFIETGSYVYTSERVGYMGFGVGGALSAAPYYHVQEELTTVVAPEDYVKVNSTDYLKQVYPQTAANLSFPDDYTARYVVDLLETELTFAGNTSKSGTVVGTSVPLSELALYITGVSVTDTPDHADNTSRCVCYHTFTPINLTPTVVTRVVWEFRW